MLLLLPCCFYIAYKKEINVAYRRWKKFLFITATLGPFFVFYACLIQHINDTSNPGSFIISIFTFILVNVLTRIFSYLRLLEVSPATASDNILNSMSNVVIITNHTLYNHLSQRRSPAII